jgi:hypothetical protein
VLVNAKTRLRLAAQAVLWDSEQAAIRRARVIWVILCDRVMDHDVSDML